MNERNRGEWQPITRWDSDYHRYRHYKKREAHDGPILPNVRRGLTQAEVEQSFVLLEKALQCGAISREDYENNRIHIANFRRTT